MSSGRFARALGLLTVCVVLGSTATASAQVVPGWLQDHTEQWYAAFNAGDAPAMAKLYAADAVLSLQGEVFEGRRAIEAFHAMNFQQASFKCTYTIKGTTTVDKIAAVWGDDACTDTPKGAGVVGHWQGHWLTVYQFEADGSWMIVRDSAEDARPSRR